MSARFELMSAALKGDRTKTCCCSRQNSLVGQKPKTNSKYMSWLWDTMCAADFMCLAQTCCHTKTHFQLYHYLVVICHKSGSICETCCKLQSNNELNEVRKVGSIYLNKLHTNTGYFGFCTSTCMEYAFSFLCWKKN